MIRLIMVCLAVLGAHVIFKGYDFRIYDIGGWTYHQYYYRGLTSFVNDPAFQIGTYSITWLFIICFVAGLIALNAGGAKNA